MISVDTIITILLSSSVGGIVAVGGMVIQSWLTQRRERRQQVWQTEISRIIDLEERAGQLVELFGSYLDLETIRARGADDLDKLSSDAGRFRRHKEIMQAIRALHHGLMLLFDEKRRGVDWQEARGKVDASFDALLAACDRVTGKR